MLNDPIEERLDKILEELRGIKDERSKLVDEVEELKQTVTVLGNSLMQHQMYLESIEAKQRMANLIISGVPENDFAIEEENLSTDEEKTKAILAQLQKENTEIENIERLGKPGQRLRMIRITLKNP